MQELLIAFVQVYVGIGLTLGAVLSLASRRKWYAAFFAQQFYPQPRLRSYLALAGVLAFVLLWPSFLVQSVIRYKRRRRRRQRRQQQ
jgi:hypothetical protein